MHADGHNRDIATLDGLFLIWYYEKFSRVTSIFDNFRSAYWVTFKQMHFQKAISLRNSIMGQKKSIMYTALVMIHVHYHLTAGLELVTLL